MKYTEKEVLQFVEENDVKFVKLMFCDIFGSLKTISVIAGELPKIFREGLIFDASKLGGFLNVTASDLRLFPDPDTPANTTSFSFGISSPVARKTSESREEP